MIKERENVIAKISIGIQVLITICAFLLSCLLSDYTLDSALYFSNECILLLLLIAPLWTLLIDKGDLGNLYRERTYKYLLGKYIKVVLLGTCLLYFATWVLSIQAVTNLHFISFIFIDFLLLIMYKLSLFKIMKFFRRKGFNSRQVLVIADNDSKDFIDRLINTKDWGYRIKAIVTSSDRIRNEYGSQAQVILSDQKIKTILDNGIIDEVFYCKGTIDQDEVSNILNLCAEVGIVFRLRPAVGIRKGMNSKFTLFNETPSFVYRNIPGNYLSSKIKNLFDYTFSFLVITIASPIFLVIAIAIKLNDGGPVFFSQERVGLNGRRFFCLKFRTMMINAEAMQKHLLDKNEQSGPIFKIRIDPRVTRVGKFLRKYSLDELPQFLNVINGDMSIVGPRPPIPSEVKQYERWQNRRLSMKPGITCIWQVSGRNNISFENWVKLDLKYIETWSLKLDFIIILKTIKVMILGDGQ